MSSPISIPEDLWDGAFEAVITNWLANDGAAVEEDDPIAEVMVEKAQYEILAPSSGKLSITAKVDDIVTKGSVIGSIS